MKKSLILALSLLLFSMVSCSGSVKGINVSEALSANEYNGTLFYKNPVIGIENAADPTVLYNNGYFYLYPTTNTMNCAAIGVWKSKDLYHWNNLGVAFKPNSDSWGITQLWAPDVIEHNDKYYMTYTALVNNKKYHNIGLAVSDSPEGPFEEIKTEQGDYFHYDFDVGMIDSTIFVDDDNRVYMYYSREHTQNYNEETNKTESWICGVELSNDLMTVLSEEPYVLSKPELSWEVKSNGCVNEAPFMIKVDGKYYLTYSGNGYTDANYSVGLVVSDNPLEGFVKNGVDNRILGPDPLSDFVAATGHHAFVKVGDEWFILYHSSKYPTSPDANRIINIDRAYVGDGNITVSGPSCEISYLPQAISGYKNIANQATITATNSVDKAYEKFLNDDFIVYRYRDDDKLWRNTGINSTITISFDSEKSVKGILIYTGLDDSEKINYCNIKVNGAQNKVNFFNGFIGTGAFEFEQELSTKKIEISVSKKNPFSISEIVVLGK